MQNKFWAIGLMALGAVTVASPVIAQGIVIGPDGVQIMEDRGRDRDRDRGRRDDRDRRGISEREAVRIARSEGLREVDNVRTDRRVYRVIGADRRGRDIRVDVDRRTGEVLSVR
jgi:uncharacterized membrane protein YkoI